MDAWWFLKEPIAAQGAVAFLSAWNHTWAKNASALGLHIDDVFGGLAQLMRLPGTLNVKLYPTLAKIVECRWDRRYELPDFEKYLLPIPEPVERTPPGRDGGRDVAPGAAFRRFSAAYEAFMGYPALEAGDCLCPAHDDSKPSLSVKVVDDLVLLCCHAGCETEDVAAALGLKWTDLFDASSKTRTGGNPKRTKVATYDYTDEEGKLQFQVVRYSPKGFSQRRPDGNGEWIPNLDGTRRVLYRLPEVLRAVGEGKTIYVVEGERDADTLVATGFVATCNSAGAGKWKLEHTQQLVGAHQVVVVADKDVAGYRHARAVRDSLRSVVGEVTIVEAAVGKDVSDHLAAGRTVDDLVASPEATESAAPNAQVLTPAEVTALVIGGASLLDRVEAFLKRFVVYPSVHALVAHVLWIAHTHRMDRWESTPRIAFLSPERGSGKTRALEVTEPFAPRAVMKVNVSPSYLFRKMADPGGLPTILYDEIDTVFGPRAKENEDIRALLNAGHRKGASAGRCVIRGKEVFTEDFPAYGAVAMAGLGGLPDTLMSRSIVVRMRRRRQDEPVEPWRRRVNTPEAAPIAKDLAAWARTIPADKWPEMPPGVTDRNADVWEAPLAVADHAGGDWPLKARAAAEFFVGGSKDVPLSTGIRLLADLRVVFANSEQLSSADIISALVAMEDSTWDASNLDPRRLSRILAEYGIGPRTVRIGSSTPKRYLRADFDDPWARYLPLAADAEGIASGPPNITSLADVAAVADVADTQVHGRVQGRVRVPKDYVEHLRKNMNGSGNSRDHETTAPYRTSATSATSATSLVGHNNVRGGGARPPNGKRYVRVVRFRHCAPPAPVPDREDDGAFDDEAVVKSSLGAPLVLSRPPAKKAETWDQPHRHVPGTTANHSGTTSSKTEPGKSGPRRVPPPGGRRVRIPLKPPEKDRRPFERAP